jgi:hypothetical protein
MKDKIAFISKLIPPVESSEGDMYQDNNGIIFIYLEGQWENLNEILTWFKKSKNES